MSVNKAYKFRIYPNKKKTILIAKTIGCSRFVFNYFLALWNDTIKKQEVSLFFLLCQAYSIKGKQQDTIWLKEVDSIALQSTLKKPRRCFFMFFQETE